MKQLSAKCLSILGVAILATAVGCEPTNDATMKGVVTLDGKPLTHGTVAFFAGGKNAAQAATGAIQSDGTFSVQVGQSGKLVTGEYVATVTASTPSIPNPDGGPPAPGDLITPTRYAAIATSGLRYNIRAGENVIDVVLVTASPEATTDVSPEGEDGSAPKADEGSAEKPVAEEPAVESATAVSEAAAE